MITHQLAVNLILERIAMAKKPTPHKKLKGTHVKNVKLTDAGKIETIDTGAKHPVVRARRKRTKGKVTGAKPAKFLDVRPSTPGGFKGQRKE